MATKYIVGLIAVVLIIAVVSGARAEQQSKSSQDWKSWMSSLNCTECADKSQCCGDEQCCSGGEFCCPNSSECCADLCCDDTETCCNEPGQESVCCIKQTTFCCPAVNKHPARCCPRWTVCCTFADLGCCDPALLRVAEEMDRLQKSPAINHQHSSFFSVNREQQQASVPTAAWGLFEHAGLSFQSLQIDPDSGGQSSRTVTGYNTWGESTRIFLYSQKTQKFYLPEANFTQPPVSSNDPEYKITLYTVDPQTGTTTATPVSGAFNLVTGYAWSNDQATITMATNWWQNGIVVGYRFYALDASTGKATYLSSYKNTPSDPNHWTGYISAVSNNGTTIYRVGYQDAVTGSNPGLGITDISTDPATTSWHNPVPVPAGYGFYVTSTLYTESSSAFPSGGFLSLAHHGISKDLDLILWDLEKAAVVATLGHAETVPIYGELAEALSPDNSYYAALVSDNFRRLRKDSWAIITVDLSQLSNASVTYHDLYPKYRSTTNSVSGLGLLSNP